MTATNEKSEELRIYENDKFLEPSITPRARFFVVLFFAEWPSRIQFISVYTHMTCTAVFHIFFPVLHRHIFVAFELSFYRPPIGMERISEREGTYPYADCSTSAVATDAASASSSELSSELLSLQPAVPAEACRLGPHTVFAGETLFA